MLVTQISSYAQAPNIKSRNTAVANSQQEGEDPLEPPSYDSRGRAADPGPLIPNPATYPAPWKLSTPSRLETTWGYGERENLYNSVIEDAVASQWNDPEYPLDPLTFKALIAQESAFDKDAVSKTGAVGLVQITAGTAENYGVHVSPPPDHRRDPAACVPAGVRILRDKHAVIKNPDRSQPYAAPVADYYEQHGRPSQEQMTTLALAGYNGGGSTVVRAMSYAVGESRDPREWNNLVRRDLPVTETPLYKAIKDTFGAAGAMEKYKEMSEYPERIATIQAREYQPLAGKKILVDPGHGGSDTGAIGPAGNKEANVNLAIGLKLRDKLQELGADVRMTRTTDANVAYPGAPQREELEARVAMANNWPAEIFVSVHSNSSANANAHGTETYHSRNASQTSKDFAKNVQEEMVPATGFLDRGVKEAGFYVIKHTTMPGILVETGFISNAVEEQQLIDNDVQDRIAQAITNGVRKTFYTNPAAVPSGPPERVLEPPLEMAPILL
jgi:N-acetylmuramoyl-L-alanine amidase CwlD